MAPIEKADWPLVGMTLDECATALRINRRTLMNLIRDTDFPARKMGGKAWRIDYDAVKRWLDHHEVPANDDFE